MGDRKRLKPGQLIYVNLVTHPGRTYKGCVVKLLNLAEKEIESASLTKVPRGLEVYAYLTLQKELKLVRPEWDKVTIPELVEEDLSKFSDVLQRATTVKPHLKEIYREQVIITDYNNQDQVQEQVINNNNQDQAKQSPG